MFRRTNLHLVALLGLILSLFSGPASAEEGPYLQVGKQISQGLSSGIVDIGYRTSRYDFSLQYVGETPIRDVVVKPFVVFNASRYWVSKRGWEFEAGLAFKRSDRCSVGDEIKCNRKLPLPVNFHWCFGKRITSDFRVDLCHDSNDDLDQGPAKYNVGLNYISLAYKIR